MTMDNTLFGIPLYFWAVLCLAVAGAYWYLWPKPGYRRVTPRTPWQQFILRYFHALVWVLLAAGCFVAGSGFGTLGLILAFLGIPVYVIFLVFFVKDRRIEAADAAAALAKERAVRAEQIAAEAAGAAIPGAAQDIAADAAGPVKR